VRHKDFEEMVLLLQVHKQWIHMTNVLEREAWQTCTQTSHKENKGAEISSTKYSIS
ncbi:hypothetical protein ACJX0J_018856, partial [Zea mays]